LLSSLSIDMRYAIYEYETLAECYLQGITDLIEDPTLVVPQYTAKIPPLVDEYRTGTNRLKYIIKFLR